jgi:hypothetical protein
MKFVIAKLYADAANLRISLSAAALTLMKASMTATTP